MRHTAAAMPRMARRAARRRGLWRLVLLGIILAVFASYVSPVRTYIQRSNQIGAETVATLELRQQHQQLLEERARLQMHGYVEQVARRDLGLVKPGEQPFVVRDLDSGSTDSAPAPAAEPEDSFTNEVVDVFSRVLP